MMEPSLRDELRGAVDDAWSETIRHLPLDQGQQDPSRARAEFKAVLRTGDRSVEEMTFKRGSIQRAGLAADGGYLRVDRGTYPNLHLRKDDKIVALDRVGQPVFLINHVDDRSHLRLICELGDSA